MANNRRCNDSYTGAVSRQSYSDSRKDYKEMTQKERVIFRKWKDTGNVIAFLPDVPANHGYCMSYEHVGQHGEADYYHCLSITVPATSEEYNHLLEELQSIGYDLVIKSKMKREYQYWICPDCHGKGWFFDGQYYRLCGLCKKD